MDTVLLVTLLIGAGAFGGMLTYACMECFSIMGDDDD